jgi:hypothetical protein
VTQSSSGNTVWADWGFAGNNHSYISQSNSATNTNSASISIS